MKKGLDGPPPAATRAHPPRLRERGASAIMRVWSSASQLLPAATLRANGDHAGGRQEIRIACHIFSSFFFLSSPKWVLDSWRAAAGGRGGGYCRRVGERLACARLLASAWGCQHRLCKGKRHAPHPCRYQRRCGLSGAYPARIVLGRMLGSFPPGLAHRLLVSAPTAAIA